MYTAVHDVLAEKATSAAKTDATDPEDEPYIIIAKLLEHVRTSTIMEPTNSI